MNKIFLDDFLEENAYKFEKRTGYCSVAILTLTA